MFGERVVVSSGEQARQQDADADAVGVQQVGSGREMAVPDCVSKVPWWWWTEGYAAGRRYIRRNSA
jgi:hypothetical protein